MTASGRRGEALCGWVSNRERGVQFRTRGDPKLWEDPVEVKPNRTVSKVEALANLSIGQALGGHQRDLQFLWREAIPRARLTAMAGLPRGAQLLTRAIGPRNGAERVERITGGTQPCARLNHTPVAAQPGPIGKL